MNFPRFQSFESGIQKSKNFEPFDWIEQTIPMSSILKKHTVQERS